MSTHDDSKAWRVGPDGRPLDPQHPWNQPQSQVTKLDPVERRLSSLERAFKTAGVALAAVEAMLLCLKHEVSPPTWAQEAAVEIMLSLLKGNAKTSGRTGNAIARYREDLKHFTRGSMVDDLRDRQDLAEDEDLFGRYRYDCYSIASRELRGTFAQGGPDAIEDSYELVNRARKQGQPRFPYLDLCVRRLRLES